MENKNKNWHLHLMITDIPSVPDSHIIGEDGIPAHLFYKGKRVNWTTIWGANDDELMEKARALKHRLIGNGYEGLYDSDEQHWELRIYAG